jgi:hypothetical protein
MVERRTVKLRFYHTYRYVSDNVDFRSIISCTETSIYLRKFFGLFTKVLHRYAVIKFRYIDTDNTFKVGTKIVFDHEINR